MRLMRPSVGVTALHARAWLIARHLRDYGQSLPARPIHVTRRGMTMAALQEMISCQ